MHGVTSVDVLDNIKLGPVLTSAVEVQGEPACGSIVGYWVTCNYLLFHWNGIDQAMPEGAES